MIRATFSWSTTNETGTILEWTKPNMHLSPYHMAIIRNAAFAEFFTEEEQIVCNIEVDGTRVAVWVFTTDQYMIDSTLFSKDSNKLYTKSYSKEVCL